MFNRDYSKDKPLPRPQAVRQHCAECREGQPSNCDMVDCELYPYRTTKLEPNATSRTQAIKNYCAGCCGGSYREKKICHITDCTLWPYRMGSPKRSGVTLPEADKIVK